MGAGSAPSFEAARRLFLRALRAGYVLGLTLTVQACGGGGEEIWIYTSVYKEVYPLYEPGLAEAFPGVTVRFYQSGSEKIAAKILAEEKGGGTRADILLTSDLFFYQELKERGRLLPFSGPHLERVPPALRDPDGAYAVNRFPLMVLAYNRGAVTGDDIPKGFLDLLDGRYAGRLTMPSPLESGTAMTTALYLHQRFGPSYFEGLRKNDILAAGGNGATLSRIQSGERPVGMVLLENVLKAQQGGLEAVGWLVPAEGALVMPSPVAVLRDTREPELAARIADWLFSDAARNVVVEGNMYSVLPSDPPPRGAPPLAELDLHPWNLETFAGWSAERQKVKSLFREIVLQ